MGRQTLRVWFLYGVCIASLLLASACGGDRAVLAANFQFFVPFGETRGALGASTITNDRAPVTEGFAVNDEYLTLLEPARLRLLVYTTGGELVIDRGLEALAPKESAYRHYCAAPSPSGSAWVAVLDSVDKVRGYQLYQIRDEKEEIESAVFIPSAVYTRQYPDRKEEYTPLLERLLVLENGAVMLTWHARVVRSYSSGRSEESTSMTSFSLYTPREKSLTPHSLDFDRFRQTESGDLRFDSVLSVHHMRDLSRFLVEVRYRKSDIRNPHERALFILDTAADTIERIELPHRTWNSLLGIARDGSLYFISEVVLYRDTTRAIISVYHTDTKKELRYAVEADPARPAMGNFVFSRRGSLYSFEVFDRGINFYSWK